MTKNNKIVIAGLAMAATSLLLLSSCASIPEKATAVKNFNKDKYLGKWYEIARLDFKWEKNLNNTTAEYSLREDGKIKVVNRGFNYKTNEQKESIGKAKFVGVATEAKLKVSFFGPFYSGYNVVAIDPDYKYALVCGKNLDYLWILSREKTIPENIKTDYLYKAKAIGYNIDDLVWVKHD
jgi:apolipoprotein D and lipocalin family protein